MDRDRLTITLRRDLLSSVDAIIDGVKIRNRSHAIEYLLSQSLGPQVRQALILAGGEGVHLRPMTYEIPKPLIPVKGRPLVEYTVELMRDAGVREVIMAVGHLGEKIKEMLGNGQKYGVRITYSDEYKPLGSAGSLKQSASLIHSQPFIVMNGDILVDINLSDVIAYHQEKSYVGTMVLSPLDNVQGYGTVQVRGDRVVKFIEKDSPQSTHLVNAGIYIFSEQILDFIPSNKSYDMDAVLTQLAQEGKLAGYVFEGDWFEISTNENYEKALKFWHS